jgi:hypothetical protein
MAVGGSGILLFFATLVAILLFALGLREMDGDGSEFLRWKVFGRIRLTTRKMLGTLFIAAFFFASSFYLTACDSEYGKAVLQKDLLQSSTEPGPVRGYSIDEENSALDLRNIRDLSFTDWYMHKLSPADWTFHKVLGAVEDGVKQVAFRHSTSCDLGLDTLEMPKGAQWIGIVDTAERIRIPFLAKLDTALFRNLFERKGLMSTYLAKIPVVEGKGQIIDYKLRYFNSFQGKDSEWVGKIFDADTRKFVLNIEFPPGKPFKSCQVFKKGAGSDKEQPDSTTSVTGLEGNRLLRWVVLDARKGEKFFLKWAW